MPITRRDYFKPIQLGGCVLWLDGADPAGTGTAPANGSTLTTWVDKSGAGRNLIVGSGTTTYTNSAITLASSYMYVTSAVNLANFSFFIIAKTNSATNNQTVFGARPNTVSLLTSSDGFGFYMDFQTAIRFFGNNTAGQFINQSIVTSNPNIFSFISGSTVINGLFNGTPVSGATGLATRTTTAQGFAIGAEWSGSAYGNTVSTASIYEIIVYNQALSTPQRQQVEAYLAQKWSLTGSLPPGHPGLTSVLYRGVVNKLTITPYYTQFSPKSIPGASLWLDGADAASVSVSSITSYEANSGVVTTLAGSGSPAFADGTGTNASFYYPTGVAVLSNSTIVVADMYNHCIRLITYPGGVVTTLAGNATGGFADATGASASFLYPNGVAVLPNGNIVVADTSNHRIRLVTYPEGVVTTIAGNGASPGGAFANGTGASASFNAPTGVAVLPNGNIVVADRGNQRIRLVTTSTYLPNSGVVTTLAGSGGVASVDGTGVGASFNYPNGVAILSNGIIVVADQFTSRIRLVTTSTYLPNSGVVTTLAGSGTNAFADGTGAAASFFYALGVAVLSNNIIVVADGGVNNRIRLVTYPEGVVTTLAGSGNSTFADGTGAAAKFYQPFSVAVLSNGTIVVCDQNNSRIRLVTPPSTTFPIWNDKSGQGNHVSGTVVGTLTNNAMVFNGTTQAFSNISYVFPHTGYSMFAVYSNTTAPAATSYMNAVYGSGGYPMLGVYGSSKFVSARSVVANTGALVTNVSASSNVLVSATYTPSTFSPFISGSPTTTLAGTTLATTGIYIGGPLNYFNGSISEVIIYSTTLSASQRQTVESYLTKKWGLTAALPASHINNTFPAGSPVALQTYISRIKTNIAYNLFLPGIPTITTPTNTGNITTLTMTWTAPAVSGTAGTVSGYIVYIVASGSPVATQTLGNVLTTSFSPMTTNLNYSYSVAATGPGGTGVTSSSSLTTAYYAPPVGGSITLAAGLTIGSGSVTITAATNATSYTVYISTTTSYLQSVFQFTTTTTGSAVAFTPLPSLSVNTAYYAVLLPVNVSIPGTYSNSTSVTTPDVLYTYSGTLTFTPAGATGKDGPTLSQCRTAYSSFGAWVDNTAYFNMTTQGIQRWTVPATRNYTIVCAGATKTNIANSGAVLTATFALTKGQILNILVGQKAFAGGAGGSFVVTSGGSALIVAGGSGGGQCSGSINASTGTSGNAGAPGTCGFGTCSCPDGGNSIGGAGGSAGGGGSGGGTALVGGSSCISALAGGAGGGGFTGNGVTVENGGEINWGGSSYSNGGVGGFVASVGGFGGGGGGGSGGGGGGGGYSGGGGGGSANNCGMGGGGGSFCSVTLTSATITNSNDGYVSIT